MKIKYWILSLVIGNVAGLLVSTIMTYMDWRLNPGGIFYNNQGTDWAIVVDTLVSWWLPIAVVVSIITLLIFYWLTRQQNRAIP